LNVLDTSLAARIAMPAQSDGDIRQALARFFADNVPAAPFDAGDDDLPLLSSGLLDSLSMLQLTTFLADTFAFELTDEDFTADNFATLGALVRLVQHKRAG
jgi:acyl carrier protein